MNILAFDLGASSGRAVVGRFDGDTIEMKEIHRFSNDPVQVGNRLYWDILRLFHEVKQGILKSCHQGDKSLKSIAIDSWAVDFGLIGKHGELLGNPYHYRDHQTNGMMEEVFSLIPREEIFSRTGIQFMPINTIYHLFSMKKAGSPILEHAETLLMIPDLLRYFLTGEKSGEFTNATTTQLFNPLTKKWDHDLLNQLGLPSHIFADVFHPGTVAGSLTSAVCKELDIPSLPVIAVGEHDTASAVAAVPTDQQDFAYLSCGTWSLLGTEVPQPILNEQALEWNFTNEGGINHTFRLLKNIMGLWLIQECKRTWERERNSLSYEQMIRLADKAKAFQSFIDPDDPMFLHPEHMPRQIRKYCHDTNQYVPQTEGEILRCIMESLALKYRLVLERTEKLADKKFSGLHMVGGGIYNVMLCQFTANAIARPVWAGPAEATAVGNLLVQYITLGKIKNIQEARQVVRNSFPVQTYDPQDIHMWDDAYGRFCKITGC
ncbi:rhamnulokinase [Paenactinomyces guangxiensis]|uniref:Rhamnulokinase n=1 Tax=Paenactinomyces guangxiensis TaxID=1490290 RepID=A0A7W2A7P0_9BACL|nr:rhamnulokinase [Paenactinomyces guangxiensis]MBA4493790.1 rhamnulokinase [Paenactinomyces guangxiensis]MBH8591079.1 rhamnulokinase [Paenactinomyces guangxiensis]